MLISFAGPAWYLGRVRKWYSGRKNATWVLELNVEKLMGFYGDVRVCGVFFLFCSTVWVRESPFEPDSGWFVQTCEWCSADFASTSSRCPVFVCTLWHKLTSSFRRSSQFPHWGGRRRRVRMIFVLKTQSDWEKEQGKSFQLQTKLTQFRASKLKIV